ncbi:MAG: glycosyltransferase, partial [Planctomycetes bacterium]|nr:glycosyltransferase [Planctomycetota bacterium]
FAAARNAALARCRGDWILSLDADERIAREDFGALLALLAGPRDTAYRLVTRNYSDAASVSGYVAVGADDPEGGGYPGWFPSTKVRLFPRIDGIGFEGAVHELIGPSLERQGIRIATADIPIHHYPLLHRTEADRLAKQHFYLALGKRKLAASPADPKAHNELGDQYVDLGEIALALQCYKEAVRLDPGNGHWLK